MKPLFLVLALGATLPAARFALAQDPLPDPANVAPATVAPADVAPADVAAAPFLWRLNLRAGQKFLTTTETSSQSVQQMPAMPGAKGAPLSMENRAQSRTTIEQNVLSSDDKGARVEVVYREMTQSNQMLQGDKVIYDSANPPAEMKGMADLPKMIEGARLSYLLSATGEISDVQGAEAYLEKMSAGLEKAFAQTPALAAMQKNMRAMMAGFLSPEMLKRSLAISYSSMPNAPVAQGETWKYVSTLPMMGTTLTQNGQSTFVSRQNGLVSIAQTGDFSTDAGAEFKIPMGAARDAKTPAPVSQIDLHGVVTGEIVVDELSGMTLRNHTSLTIEGETVMSGLTGKGSVLSIPMKATSETTITTEELKTTP